MRNNQPIHLQIKTYVLDSVRDGLYKPGDQLPSQRELGEMFEASHMTVRRAIDDLLSDGDIFAIPGKGLYISDYKAVAETGAQVSFSEDMHRRGLEVCSKLLSTSTKQATPLQARSLGIEINAPLYFIHRLRYAGQKPIVIQEAFLPAELCQGLLDHDFEQESLFDVLRNTYGYKITKGTGVISATLATREEARLLELVMPAALLISERVTMLDDERPIELVRSAYCGDRYQMTLDH